MDTHLIKGLAIIIKKKKTTAPYFHFRTASKVDRQYFIAF